MLPTRPVQGDEAAGRSRIGLALAGGGPLGIIYEIGAVLALSEALEGIHFNALDVYVGVSAGGAVASSLANGLTPAQLCEIFVLNRSAAFPIDPQRFLRPAWRLYAESALAIPGLLIQALQETIQHPYDSLLVGLSNLGRTLPGGLLNNDAIAEFVAKLHSSRGCTDDFRKLKRKLYIVATNLDTGEAAIFGAPSNDHIPISKAVQATTALPGLFPPVEIDGRFYVDGALKRTLHASVALQEGARLLICINPLVAFNANLAPPNETRYAALVEGGLPVVLTQTFYALIHSRMKVGMAHYQTQYPDRDVLLFEPNSGDAEMFLSNAFSFANRARVCEHAYRTTRQDLLDRQEVLLPMLARHGIILRTDILADHTRHFDSHLHIPPETLERARRQNPVTNVLSEVLDRLQDWLEEQAGQAPHQRNPSC